MHPSNSHSLAISSVHIAIRHTTAMFMYVYPKITCALLGSNSQHIPWCGDIWMHQWNLSCWSTRMCTERQSLLTGTVWDFF